jgi:hypothetical protein
MIFSDSHVKARNELDDLVDSLPSDEWIISTFISNTECRVKTNKRTFLARKFSPYCRGYRFRDVYIDQVLANDPHILSCILPCLAPPYGWWENEYDWKMKDHIYYFDGGN